jgi:putative restriction endonuclease
VSRLILNQYRNGSSYKDEVGTLYHFPKRYLKRIQSPAAKFIYYEPRAGGEQVYFRTRIIGQVWPDPDDAKHYYSEILDQLLG